MKKIPRKVVILENLTSPYIHQAIIVLNDYKPSQETKVIMDAERVVNDYLKTHSFSPDKTKVYAKKKKNKSGRWLGWMGVIAATVVALIIRFC